MTELDQLHRDLLDERQERLQGTWRQTYFTTEPSLREVADHEAAHLVAAVALRGMVFSVEIHRPGSKAADRHGYGATHTAPMRLSADDALIALAGYAWEEGCGSPSRAGSDLSLGHYHATEAAWLSAQQGRQPDDHLQIARRFVSDHFVVIRATGGMILDAMPMCGPLKGRRLDKIIDWVGGQLFGQAVVRLDAKKKIIIPPRRIAARDFYARRRY